MTHAFKKGKKKMTFEELKQYNALVITTAQEVARPWKWATFILAGLLAGMVALYFLCPAEVEVNANKNTMTESIISQKG